MDYEKKYKDALEIARKINSGEGVAAPPDWTSYEVIFPELKESEDERVRKAIIRILKGETGYTSKEDTDRYVTWLEKQKLEEVKEVVFRPTAGYSIGIAVLQAIKKQRESRENIVLAFNGAYIPVNGKTVDEIVAEYHTWLEKQRQEPKKVSIWKHWKNGIAGNGEGRQVYLIRTDNTYDLSSVLSFECDYIELSELDKLMLEKQGKKQLVNFDEAEKEKNDFVGDGFLECHADFLDFKDGETYWLEYIGDDNYNVRSDNLLGRTYHITPCQLYTVFKKLTWLEKQGEKKSAGINGEDYGIDGLYHAINILEKTIGRVGGYQSDDGILEHKAAINAVKELYEKQYAQKHFSDFNANDWYVSKVDGKIHNMKYNPTDKVKPKFKVGDWCIDKQDGTIFCIENVTENTYDYKTDKGNSYSCTHGSLELDSRLWTIADAKDGDVLAINWHEDDDSWEKIIIFKKYHNKGVKGLYSAPCVEGYGNTFKNGKLAYPEEVPYYSETWTANLHPATKEQRDLLFQKIADAGCYEWDAEKKELKKIIEPKTLDTDKVIGWIVANIYNFEYYVKRFKEDFGL